MVDVDNSGALFGESVMHEFPNGERLIEIEFDGGVHVYSFRQRRRDAVEFSIGTQGGLHLSKEIVMALKFKDAADGALISFNEYDRRLREGARS